MDLLVGSTTSVHGLTSDRGYRRPVSLVGPAFAFCSVNHEISAERDNFFISMKYSPYVRIDYPISDDLRFLQHVCGR
jgi:hypothetical protein